MRPRLISRGNPFDITPDRFGRNAASMRPRLISRGNLGHAEPDGDVATHRGFNEAPADQPGKSFGRSLTGRRCGASMRPRLISRGNGLVIFMALSGGPLQ